MIDVNIGLGTFRVKELRFLTPETFVLRTDKNHVNFIPGQRMSINLRNDKVKRSYSIFSGKDDSYLEFLIREVTDGYLTPKLKPFTSGDELEIFGPKGNFTLQNINTESDKVLFISTGTGIAPFHSMIKSHPSLDYQLIQGVKFSYEAYHRNNFEPSRLTVCTSQEKGTDFHGRVTDYLENIDFTVFDHIYLCGNKQMIDDVISLSLRKGVVKAKIHTEVYF